MENTFFRSALEYGSTFFPSSSSFYQRNRGVTRKVHFLFHQQARRCHLYSWRNLLETVKQRISAEKNESKCLRVISLQPRQLNVVCCSSSSCSFISYLIHDFNCSGNLCEQTSINVFDKRRCESITNICSDSHQCPLNLHHYGRMAWN